MSETTKPAPPNFTGQAPRAYLTVHPGEADTVEVARGQYVQVADTMGGQVALFTAFRQDYYEEYVSTSQTIAHNRNFMLQTGHVLMSNLGNPMLTLLEDTVGRHDFCCPPMTRASILTGASMSPIPPRETRSPSCSTASTSATTACPTP